MPSSRSITVIDNPVATRVQAACLNASKICSGRPASAAWIPEASISATTVARASSEIGPISSVVNHGSVSRGVVAVSSVVQIHSINTASPRAIHDTIPSKTDDDAVSSTQPNRSLTPGSCGITRPLRRLPTR